MRDDERQTGDEALQESLAAPSRPAPVFNLPPLLVGLLGIMIVLHVVREFILPVDVDNWLIFTFSFIPARYVEPFSQQNFEWLWSPLTYSFLHGSFEHLIFNGLWLMAFGAPVLRRIGNLPFCILWIVSSAAAFGHGYLNDWAMSVLVGASGVVSALMGAACRFAFAAPGRGYPMAFGHLNPRLSIVEALRNRTVQVFVGLWFLGNLLIAYVIPLIGEVGNIAWDAHIVGFLIGFLCFDLFDRRKAEKAHTEET